MNYESMLNYVMFCNHFMNYECIFNYLMYSNSNSNSSESSYDPRVTIFFSLSDPPPSYEFDNIAINISHNPI